MSFSISELQYQTVLNRITALEEQANDQAVANSKYVTLTQVNQLSVLLQGLIDNLSVRVDSLDSRTTAIENEPRL